MPTTIRSAVVFCGSRPGRDPAWRDAAEALGRGMAKAGIRLIYGGGRTGLMGAVADGALAAGGAVTGIIPTFLQAREVAHVDVQDLIITDSMHSRKQLMFEHADAFRDPAGRAGHAGTRWWRSSPGGSSASTTSRSWWRT
ncbi:MAG: TIGR00730 family Rossman fold protein [Acetobacteraceae bacterium]